MRIPVLIHCECGRTISGDAGDDVACSCGRRYATELSAEQRGALQALGTQMRVFARLGVGLVGLFAVLGFTLVGRLAGVAAFVVGAVLWWVVLQPVWRRRAVARLAALPPAPVRSR